MKAIVNFKDKYSPENGSTTTLVKPNMTITREEVINHFGLNNPDVEWYNITLEED